MTTESSMKRVHNSRHNTIPNRDPNHKFDTSTTKQHTVEGIQLHKFHISYASREIHSRQCYCTIPLSLSICLYNLLLYLGWLSHE